MWLAMVSGRSRCCVRPGIRIMRRSCAIPFNTATRSSASAVTVPLVPWASKPLLTLLFFSCTSSMCIASFFPFFVVLFYFFFSSSSHLLPWSKEFSGWNRIVIDCFFIVLLLWGPWYVLFVGTPLHWL